MILLAYSDSIVTQAFNELQCIPIIETERIQGRTLSGVEYNHKKSSRTNYKIVISADELIDTDKLTFIQNFYKANEWYFSLTDYVDPYVKYVLKEAGDIPIENIEGNISLPEITFTLVQKEAD